jgi:hypothetical protein
MSETSIDTIAPTLIAFIIDNEVVEIIAAVDKFAAIVLSDPIIVDITDKKNTVNAPRIGSIYNPLTSEFTNPE